MRWRYNPKLGRWYHPTSATSDNGPDDPPAEIEGSGLREGRKSGWGDRVAARIKRLTRGRVKECGGCRKRRRWLNRAGEVVGKVAAALNSLLPRKPEPRSGD
jgi:hypothetical protein